MNRQLKSFKMWGMAAVLTLIVSVPMAMAIPEEIVGAVVDTGTGYAVIADSGEYLVLNRNLSKYVGDTVMINGNVEVGADTLAFDHINSIEVVSPHDLIDPAVPQRHVGG